jgi:hypothetical protein
MAFMVDDEIIAQLRASSPSEHSSSFPSHDWIVETIVFLAGRNGKLRGVTFEHHQKNSSRYVVLSNFDFSKFKGQELH